MEPSGIERAQTFRAMEASVVRVRDLVLSYGSRVILAGVRLQVEPGTAIAVMGPSGSGKTSLLHCIAGIVRPQAGSVEIDGLNVTALSAADRARFRLERIGMVFQFGELLPELTVGENVALPLRLLGRSAREAADRARAALAAVGIGHLEHRHPGHISGGEMQRAAIARAVVTGPKVLLADEPTGALDEENTETVARLITEQARSLGAAVIIATHNPDVARHADRVLRLRAGRLEEASRLVTA